ncbi:MAG: hypothetical protein IH621_08075, partial [Krumholzibacteria bacterium]|nr:hypothetical protein [Candidatus Krumholzibacteria bacterium]
PPGLGGLGAAAAQSAAAASGPFFVSFVNTPKAGVKASVQQYQYYGEWLTNVGLSGGASFENKLGWSWADYRKQDKTIERREDQLNWNAGALLPLTATILGTWDWSEDRTVNATGYENLAKRDYLRGSLNLAKSRYRTGAFVHTFRGVGTVEDQKSITQNQRNDFTEGTAAAGLQSGLEIAPGVTLAGRLYASGTSGTRSLGERDAPSSASGDTLGVGVYYDRRWAGGRVHVSRANFDKRYLDYRRNANGLVDTTGLPEDQKIVSELEAKDALAMEFENTLRLGRFKLVSSLSRATEDLEYAASGKGLTERQEDRAAAALSFAAGRDSFVVDYGWQYRWDDQRYKNATTYRGRQYSKNRDLGLAWYRTLFRATKMTFRAGQRLGQEIAQDQYNENDKDRLQSDLNLKVERAWSAFRTQLACDYRQIEDLSIRESRSSNNNLKDNYAIAPAYTWDPAAWLRLTQSYRLDIEYTDYVHSGLESVSRNDDYNKRGNLATQVSVQASERLELVAKHDYNKRFNATKTGEDAAGGSTYFKDKIVTTNKLDLRLTFEAAPGVILETATYRQKDITDTFGRTTRTTVQYSGEVWVGAQVRKKWGKTSPLELAAMVRKFNAYGPSITETSADYWETDVWLKWSF